MVEPWTKKYGTTFTVAVDPADVFGAAFGLKAIPVSYLVDEVGIIRLKGGGPSEKFRAQIEQILREPISTVRAKSPELPSARSDAHLLFTQGLTLLRQSKTNDALVAFKQARDLDPSNWRIRKQIWAIEHPEKFYGKNGIDWTWQKEELARERK